MKITIRPWTAKDIHTLQILCDQADRTYLSERMPSPYTLQDAQWWLDHIQEEENEKKGVFRAICLDEEIIGNISIEKMDDVRCQDSELGYFLDRAYWSKGIMTKAVPLICEEAFHQLDIIRISALVYAPNIASRRVLEKNDFVMEGILRQAITKKSSHYDAYLYAKYRQVIE